MWLLDLLGSRPFFRLKEVNMADCLKDLSKSIQSTIDRKLTIDLEKSELDFSKQALIRAGWSQARAAAIQKYLINNVDSIATKIKGGRVSFDKDRLVFTYPKKRKGTKTTNFNSISTMLASKIMRGVPHLRNKGGHRKGVADIGHDIQNTAALNTTLKTYGSVVENRESFAQGVAEKSVSDMWKKNSTALKALKQRYRSDRRADGKVIQSYISKSILISFVKGIVDTNFTGDLVSMTMEPSKKNQDFGKAEAIIGKEAADALIKEYAKLSEEALEKVAQNFDINCTSSPSVEDDITEAVINTIIGIKKVKKKAKKKTVKTEAPKVSVRTRKIPLPINTAKGKGKIEAQMSPLALRGLLQRAISEAVQRNMGKGRARKVLNYRTGRFAESVNIDNVVPRRDGAMVAFYSYMKNPYSTFAEGGAQYHKGPSRDPNLLIKKSMRQLAAAAAVTRFFPMES